MDMSISADGMLMQMAKMRMQAGGVGGVSGIVTPQDTQSVQTANGAEFGTMLKSALDGVNEMQINSNNLKTNFDLGDRSVSLAEVMIAGQKAGLALEATVQVRNKMVEAYKTIMQMQI